MSFIFSDPVLWALGKPLLAENDNPVSNSAKEEGDVQCCDLDSNNRRWKFPSSFDAEKCFPIRIPENDPVWGPRGRTCIEFIRSAYAFFSNQNIDCKL